MEKFKYELTEDEIKVMEKKMKDKNVSKNQMLI
jgi:hypothetical protein